jgi:5-methylcytosine-specific restriction endonuclease McrA
MSNYKDEDWLRREYVEKGRNGTDIADECGVTHGTIYYYLDKFGIDKRSRGFRKGDKHPNYKNAKREYECPVCGETFKRRPSDVKNVTNGPFCDRSCMGKFREGQMQGNDRSMSGEEHPFHDAPEENPMFGVRGDDHPNWKGGYEQDFREGPEWYHTRKDVLDRDGEQCQDCGLPRDEHRDTFDRDLEVHHITPVSEGGAKLDMENLVTLCVPCHLERHRD